MSSDSVNVSLDHLVIALREIEPLPMGDLSSLKTDQECDAFMANQCGCNEACQIAESINSPFDPMIEFRVLRLASWAKTYGPFMKRSDLEKISDLCDRLADSPDFPEKIAVLFLGISKVLEKLSFGKAARVGGVYEQRIYRQFELDGASVFEAALMKEIGRPAC